VSIASNLSLGPFKIKIWAKKFCKGGKIHCSVLLTEGGEEITQRVGNLGTPTKIKKNIFILNLFEIFFHDPHSNTHYL